MYKFISCLVMATVPVVANTPFENYCQTMDRLPGALAVPQVEFALPDHYGTAELGRDQLFCVVWGSQGDVERLKQAEFDVDEAVMVVRMPMSASVTEILSVDWAEVVTALEESGCSDVAITPLSWGPYPVIAFSYSGGDGPVRKALIHTLDASDVILSIECVLPEGDDAQAAALHTWDAFLCDTTYVPLSLDLVKQARTLKYPDANIIYLDDTDNRMQFE